MKTIYERPKIFTDAITTYCGGCGHGIVNKLLAELIDEMGLQKNGIIVWPIGCPITAKLVRSIPESSFPARKKFANAY